MNKMQFACFSLVGFMFLTGCGATAPNRTATLNDVYASDAQNLYGKLRIAFSAADYSTQATTSEVNSLKVTVSGEKLAAPVVKTVAKDAASAVEFPGLPIGTIVLKVQALSAAFNDSFEAGMNNWEASFTGGTPVSNWDASTVAASNGTHCVTPGDATAAVTTQGTYILTLKNGIDLSSSSNPTLTFNLNNFVPRYYFRNATLTVEATSDGTWKKVGEVTDATSAWTPTSFSLASVKGNSVKVRFNFNYNSIVTTGTHSAAQIDEVTIK